MQTPSSPVFDGPFAFFLFLSCMMFWLVGWLVACLLREIYLLLLFFCGQFLAGVVFLCVTWLS
ncbi:MAG: hypothetical protein J3R72DRAFT_463785 [Linnemannia gamsii]|nr:MAG: hypothetical protein J3R72DRAFT_463785 [Linnemannia gamsii]